MPARPALPDEFRPASDLVKPTESVRAFVKRSCEVGGRALEAESVLLVHHFDADGLSSGGIATRALTEKGIPFRALCVKKMLPPIFSKMREAPEKTLLLCDISTGFLSELSQMAAAGKTVVVLDHHPPETAELHENVLLANPHSFGLDGATDACGASTSYFAFREHVSKDAGKIMAQSAIVGAVGDVQDRNGLVAANALLLQQALAMNVVSVDADLRMFGRVSRGLVQFLSYCSEPYLPGISGSDKNAALFLYKHGLPLFEDRENGRHWLRYRELAEEEKGRLRGALLAYGAGQGIPPEELHQMLGPVYTFLNEPLDSELSDAYEFSTLLNACGRHDYPELGVKLASGDRALLEDGRKLLLLHRTIIRRGIAFARKQTEDFGSFFFLDARGQIEDSVVGTVAGSFFGSQQKRDKPVIAFSLDEERLVKVSGRGTQKLVEKGLHLGRLMREAAGEVKGFGGGHNIAAGASFVETPENVAGFLLAAKRVLRKQLGN